ncbi:MAG: hypothetical protein WCH44_16065 [Betaproteobacteria bacterium]
MRSECRRSWPCSIHQDRAFSSSAGVVSVGVKALSIQSGGKAPMPGWGLSLGLWNMLRISAAACTGARSGAVCAWCGTRGRAAPAASRT